MAVTSPFPNLQVHPNSGLSFPWAEEITAVKGTFGGAMGSDGISLTMIMWVYWRDISRAVTELLGYTARGSGLLGPVLNRHLPWQHPFTNQLWVKDIVAFEGIQSAGTLENANPGGGSAGSGYPINTGPMSDWNYGRLTLRFWRPPYYVRTDADITELGYPQEWLRYCDKHWSVQTQMLTSGVGAWKWNASTGATLQTGAVAGGVGTPVTKMRLSRTWYEIPEQALFATSQDSTPQGIPTNLLYTQTATTNPMTGYVYPVGSPINFTVNSPIGGGVTDSESLRFMGFKMGTLLYEGAEIKPRPLQLPPALMQIPSIAGNEPISQVQYDVTFNFTYFDPPRGKQNNGDPISDLYRGHNLVPYPANGLWFPVESQYGANGQASSIPSNPPLTLYQYADFSDLFTIL